MTETLFPELSENPWKIAPLQPPDTNRKRQKFGLITLELCAGGGGQALGFEQAGIEHVGLVENDKKACDTLKLNRPGWNVVEQDLNKFDGSDYAGVDIISGGLPCPPFSLAGKKLGTKDERNLFPAMIRLVDEIRPKAIMIENVRGILDASFVDYRLHIKEQLRKLGYKTGWKLMNASDYGVPQLRPRVVFIGLRGLYSEHFAWPQTVPGEPGTVGDVLYDLMAAKGWRGARAWKERANEIAPTIVGGSHRHGGPDLGPTWAKRAWATLGVDAMGVANEAPEPDFVGMPKLTVRMAARLQGFPDDWQFAGPKTTTYKQVGNAFPPPFAKAIAERIRECLETRKLVRMTA